MNARIDEADARAPAPRSLSIRIVCRRLAPTDNPASRSRGTWAPFATTRPSGWPFAKAARMERVPCSSIFRRGTMRFWRRTAAIRMNAGTAKKTQEIAETLGFDSVDTLWDHMFEQPSRRTTSKKRAGDASKRFG